MYSRSEINYFFRLKYIVFTMCFFTFIDCYDREMVESFLTHSMFTRLLHVYSN